ncbi:hypothetical protein RYH73_00920 [Olivibacter sp. CPCC 100613]|uniref:hypothetical protein n=1 Tax=Olivibacter sp. CPCC 100613 TaxID=3079931 RepID=UPI002FF4B232
MKSEQIIELSMDELQLIEGGHIDENTSFGHDIGYAVGLYLRYCTIPGQIYGLLK